MPEIHGLTGQRSSMGSPKTNRAREVVRHTGGIVRGKFPSKKCGRMIHHEGLLELDAYYLFEASPLIAEYQEQPCSIRYPDGDRLRKYTPDILLRLTSQELVYVEIKPEKTAQRPEMAHKLACIQRHFSMHGQRFVVLTDETIRLQPRLNNLRWIYQRTPRARPAFAQIMRGVRLLLDKPPLTIKAAEHLLKKENCDPFTLLLMGLLRAPLDQSVSIDTLVSVTKENDHEWFQLTNGLGF